MFWENIKQIMALNIDLGISIKTCPSLIDEKRNSAIVLEQIGIKIKWWKPLFRIEILLISAIVFRDYARVKCGASRSMWNTGNVVVFTKNFTRSFNWISKDWFKKNGYCFLTKSFAARWACVRKLKTSNGDVRLFFGCKSVVTRQIVSDTMRKKHFISRKLKQNVKNALITKLGFSF